MSLFDKASAMASTLASKAKAAAMNVSEIELKVQEATNLDPWGPHGTLMSEIAQAAFDPSNYALIMAVVEQRLLCSGAQWRHVYKSLLLLEFMSKRGPTRIVEYLRASQSMLERLQQNFEYRDENGRDQGINVRERAKHIVALINDESRLKAERDKAAQNAGKYTGVSSAGGSHSGSSSPPRSQPSRRNEASDPMEATRQRIERLKADGALPDAPSSSDAFAAEAATAPKPRKKLSEIRVNPAISAAISSMPVAAAAGPCLLSSQPSYTPSPAAAPVQAATIDLLSDLDMPPVAAAPASAAFPIAGPAAAEDDWSNFSAAPTARSSSKIDVNALLNMSGPAPSSGGALPLDAFSSIPVQPLRPTFSAAGGRPSMPFSQAPAFGAAPPAAATSFDPFAPQPPLSAMPTSAPSPAAAVFDPFAPMGAAVPAAAAVMPLTAATLIKPTMAAGPRPKLGPETAASQRKKSDPFADLLSL